MTCMSYYQWRGERDMIDLELQAGVIIEKTHYSRDQIPSADVFARGARYITT